MDTITAPKKPRKTGMPRDPEAEDIKGKTVAVTPAIPCRRAAGLPHLRLAGADDGPAARPRHDGRRGLDIPKIRAWMEAQGFRGHSEVEIFSNIWWARPMDEVLATCIERHRGAV